MFLIPNVCKLAKIANTTIYNVLRLSLSREMQVGRKVPLYKSATSDFNRIIGGSG